MDTLIEDIRAATATDATDDARATGAIACRTLLAALEAKVGEPLASPTTALSSVQDRVPTPPPAAAVQAIAAALRGMQPDQLLDLAIARLRAAVPAGSELAPVQGVKFHILPMPPIGGRS